MNEIRITHLKPNSQKTEAWVALLEGEVVGHIYMEKEIDKCYRAIRNNSRLYFLKTVKEIEDVG